MTLLRRALFAGLLLSTAAGLLLRWRNPGLLVLGHRATAVLAIVALACLGLRVLMMAFQSAARELPWTRLLIPSVIWLEGVGLAWNGAAAPGWQQLRLLTAALLELAFLGFALRIWWRRAHDSAQLPEDGLAIPVAAFLPPRAARLVAMELVMAGGALRFILGGHRRPDPVGHSYTQRCVLGALLPALPVLLLADLVALEFLLVDWPKLRLFIHLSDAYAILWFTGLWASFRARPHRIEGDRVVLNHGFLGRMELRKDQIVDLAPPPVFKDDWARLAHNRKVAQLQAPGPPLLDLQLSGPIAPMGLLGPGKPKSIVRIAVDDPEAFKAALGLP